MASRTMRFVSSGLVILIVISAIDASISDHLNGTRRIPEIKPGQKCVKGQLYRMDCNTCHCSEGSQLLCTKMGCLNALKSGVRRADDQKTCTAGKLYKKGCSKCFCTDKGRLKCSPADCNVVDKAYTNPEHVKPYGSAEFYKLPALAHTGMACEPGLTYRVDCNTCFCLDTANLMCQKLLCPSFNDVYSFKAKDMTGKPCNASYSTPQDCLDCECKAAKYECKPKPECSHTDGRRTLHGEYPMKHDRNYIDVDKMKEKCQPGMVYKVLCNKCYCQEDGSLRCTQKTCLNHSEVERLKKLRAKLEKEDPDD